MIGSTIGHYKIESKLGEGGMGVVYKATDTKLNRPVALKFLPAHVSEAEKDKERFIQEAQTAASLSHANICTIFGIEEQDGKQFIVMEYVDGQTLQEKRQSLSLKQALEIGIQIADGLAAAHEKGIVHRDIKPENIMIRKDGTVQIMDFGLAKLRGATRLTKEGSTVGTVGYMSPEQVQGQEVDHRTDIFSLGVLLYEMISDQSPFKGVHETAIIYEIVHVDPPPIGTIRPEIDTDLDAVVLDCLAKDPADRYQSAAEVARNLRRLKRESSRSRVSRMTGSRTAYVPAGSSTAGQEPRRNMRSAISWGASALLFGIALFFGWLYFTYPSSDQKEVRFHIPPPPGIAYGVLFGGDQAISPDGTMIVFTGVDSARNTSLYLRKLDEITPRRLPGTEGAGFAPFWSPDNRWIGFVADEKLKKLEISGGSPMVICDASSFRGASWNSSDQIIFNGVESSVNLWVVESSGGRPRRVTSIDSSTNASQRWPWFLPDGDHFLFSEGSVVGSTEGKILVGSLSSPDVDTVLEVRSNAVYADGYLYYYRDNKVVAQKFDPDSFELSGSPVSVTEDPTYDVGAFRADFSVSNNGMLVQTSSPGNRSVVSTSLRWVDRENHSAPGPEVQGDVTEVSLSRDGSTLALTEGTPGAYSVWTFDRRRQVRARLTFGPGIDRFPVWSHDDRFLYFMSTRDGGTPNLYRKSTSGVGKEERLATSSIAQLPTDVSPDGKYLLYFQPKPPDNKPDIYALPLTGEPTPMPVVTNDFSNVWAVVSPDGRWVAYMSDETGAFQIYVMPFPPNGSRWQISSGQGGAWGPKWNPQGKELLFLSGGYVMSVPVDARREVFLPGTPRELIPFNGGPGQFGVTPDGKQFVLLGGGTPTRPNDPLLVVMNWRKNK